MGAALERPPNNAQDGVRNKGLCAPASAARLSFFQTTTISRQRHLNSKVSDADMARAADRWPINTPVTKEEYYYRNVFSRQVILRDRRGLLASNKGMNENARARAVARHEARLRSRQRAEE